MIKNIYILENPKIYGIEKHKYKIERFLRKKKLIVQEKPTHNTDLVITLGGDGTLLKAIHLVKNEKALFLGIKFGKVGFLTNKTKNIKEKLENILKGKFKISERMCLEVAVKKDGKVIMEDFCFNEIVLYKNGIRIVEIFGKRNNKEFLKYRGDGIIIATPTGSTAHSFSAGGPIVFPDMEMISIVPICPYTLFSRPIILPPSEKIEIRVNSESNIVCDGQRKFIIKPEYSVSIKKSNRKIKLLIDKDSDFFKTFKEKFGDIND